MAVRFENMGQFFTLFEIIIQLFKHVFSLNNLPLSRIPFFKLLF